MLVNQFSSIVNREYLSNMINMCGVYSIALHLKNNGVSLADALATLKLTRKG